MDLTNAERQRRYIARLKARASSRPDHRLPTDPWPALRLAEVDPDWTVEELKVLPPGWRDKEAEAVGVLNRLTSRTFGTSAEHRLGLLREAIHLMEFAGPQFISAAKRYLAQLEAEFQQKESKRKTKAKPPL